MRERARITFDQSIEDLSKYFNVSATIRAVVMPRALHDEFLDLYRRIDAFGRKITAIHEDGEHQLALDEWRHDFRLPSADFLTAETAKLKQTMTGFDPYRADTQKSGKVSIAAGQAQGFFDTFTQGYDIVHALFEMFRSTDYMRFMRHLRDVDHTPYAGPTATKELTSVYFGLVRANRGQKAYLETLIDHRNNLLEPKVEAALAQGGALTEFLQTWKAGRQSVPAPR